MSGGPWGAEGYEDPEDEEERELAEERQAENRRMSAAEREKRHRERATGFSEVEDGENGDDLLKRLARTHAHLAISTLVEVAENGTKDAARNTAAKELLARGFGGVTRKSEQKVDVKITDQRAAHFHALQELAKRNPVLDITDAEFREIEDDGTPKQITGNRNGE